jgi:hypothetical protein
VNADNRASSYPLRIDSSRIMTILSIPPSCSLFGSSSMGVLLLFLVLLLLSLLKLLLYLLMLLVFFDAACIC